MTQYGSNALFPGDYSSLMGNQYGGMPTLGTPMETFNPMAGVAGGIGGLSGMGGMGADTGWASKFGGTMGVAKAGIAGLQTLGQLWMGFKAAKMAKKQFQFTKDITNTNLANQIKTYNTALADRARGRGVMESQSQATQDSYVRDNSLSRSAGTGSNSSAYASNYRDDRG